VLCLALIPATALAQHYTQTNLVSDLTGIAAVQDLNLVNAWGIARSPSGPWWVADNGTGLSTLYTGSGQIVSLVVSIPGSSPTGTVFNGSPDFRVAPNAPARFIFVTESGVISGWSPGVNMTNAIQVAASATAIYKGVTIGQVGGTNYLYAANFHDGTVDVYDATFSPATLSGGGFVDPALPAGFAPFNVQNIGGNIVVTFAKQDEDKEDEIAGAGLGAVDVFDTSGNLLLRLTSGAWLNAPWGVALAPADFGGFSNRLLVGQFGSGQIAVYDLKNGNFHGLVRNARGKAIQIDGLWALQFGNGGSAGPRNTLFFSAGIDDEAHGLFGTITPVPASSASGH
jgi:uncharacterized protein (TIGR03118 family)